MSVDARARSFCNKCWGLDRVWAGGDKVSEVKVAPGWPWQWLGDRQEGWLRQKQNAWLWRSRKAGGLSQGASRSSGAAHGCAQSGLCVRWREVGAWTLQRKNEGGSAQLCLGQGIPPRAGS